LVAEDDDPPLSPVVPPGEPQLAISRAIFAGIKILLTTFFNLNFCMFSLSIVIFKIFGLDKLAIVESNSSC